MIVNGHAGAWRHLNGRTGVGTPRMIPDVTSDRIFHPDLKYPPRGFQFIVE